MGLGLRVGFAKSPLVNGFAERIIFDVQLFGHLSARLTEIEQFLGFSLDLLVQDSTAGTNGSGCKEGLYSPSIILLDTAFDTTAGHAKHPNNVALLATGLTDQLGRKHAKGLSVLIGMKEDWIDATEIGPSAVLTRDAESTVDLCDAVRYKG